MSYPVACQPKVNISPRCPATRLEKSHHIILRTYGELSKNLFWVGKNINSYGARKNKSTTPKPSLSPSLSLSLLREYRILIYQDILPSHLLLFPSPALLHLVILTYYSSSRYIYKLVFASSQETLLPPPAYSYRTTGLFHNRQDTPFKVTVLNDV